MAELENDCCTAEAQASCCEPTEKASCCGDHGEGCGCTQGATDSTTPAAATVQAVQETVREKYAAAARAAPTSRPRTVAVRRMRLACSAPRCIPTPMRHPRER